jgi:glycosyltransferase involved in cell wall biosynthesis
MVNCHDCCGAVIPCFNEARSISRLVVEVRRYVPQIVVIDDGSTDATARLAAERGAIVLSHQRRQGKGAALCSGLSYLEARGFSWALTLDGDGQHDPSDIPAFLDRAALGDTGLVAGDRMINPEGMPPVRRLANHWMSKRLSHLSGQHLPDSQCGYRLLRLDVWSQLRVRTRHFETESEMLIGFIHAGQKIAFVPVKVIYRKEQSKIHPLADSVRWLWWWMRTRRTLKQERPLPEAPLAVSSLAADP